MDEGESPAVDAELDVEAGDVQVDVGKEASGGIGAMVAAAAAAADDVVNGTTRLARALAFVNSLSPDF